MDSPERVGRAVAYNCVLMSIQGIYIGSSKDCRTRRDKATCKHLAKIHNRLLKLSKLDWPELSEHRD